MLVIRLSRTGKKHVPSYRIVAADKKRSATGKYNEILGYYLPISPNKDFSANKERILELISNGAQVSDTVHNLLCHHDILPKKDKRKILFARKKIEEEEKPKAEVKSNPKNDIETPSKNSSVDKLSDDMNQPTTEDATPPESVSTETPNLDPKDAVTTAETPEQLVEEKDK